MERMRAAMGKASSKDMTYPKQEEMQCEGACVPFGLVISWEQIAERYVGVPDSGPRTDAGHHGLVQDPCHEDRQVLSVR